MFDWNDEELTNIIWGEATESDDHIVPYQEGTENYCNKKEWSEQSITFKPTDVKSHQVKADLHGRKPENDSSVNPNEGISTSEFRMDSWSELSISNTSEINQDTTGAKPSRNLSEITRYSSSCVGGTNVFDKEPVFENLHEGKEQGDFADYSWDNVGSFDDLDRIFSNDEPMFGNVNLPSADELWSSSKDGDSPGKSFNTTGDSTSSGSGVSRKRTFNQNAKFKTQCKQEDDHNFDLSYGSIVDPASHVLKSVECAGNKSKFVAKEQLQENVKIGGKRSATRSCPTAVRVSTPNKVADKCCMPPYGQKKLLKYQKRADEISEGKPVHDFHGSWSPSGSPMGLSANQLASSSLKPSPSSAMSQQTQPQLSDCEPQKHIADTFIGHATYGNHINSYQAMPVVSSVQLNEGVTRTSGMTPQEKIEKLRRRQQMQALLAIQKQQQQFSHQVPLANPLALTGTQEDQIRRFEGPNIQRTGGLHSFEPRSPYEQDDSCTVSVTIDDSSGEYKVLHQLQDVISKLDVRIRLGIRDSLFRLAQCAIQRHHVNDTSSTNKGGREEPEVMKKTIGQDRFAGTETETNPIDRTVAHLLFQRPWEFSVNHPDTPESPASCKLSGGLKAGILVNPPPMQCAPDTGVAQPYITYQGSENLCSIAGITSSSPCLDNADYTSNYAPSLAEGGAAIKANEGRSKPEAL